MTQNYGYPPPVQDAMTPGYAAPNAGYGYPPVPQTNGLAIASLVCALVGLAIVPIILGHIALSQIRQRGESGRGLALAGLIIGYVEVGVAILAFIFMIGLWGVLVAAS